jgi:hypothetical protein
MITPSFIGLASRQQAAGAPDRSGNLLDEARRVGRLARSHRIQARKI